jgi:hypothetical protein
LVATAVEAGASAVSLILNGSCFLIGFWRMVGAVFDSVDFLKIGDVSAKSKQMETTWQLLVRF